MFILNYRVSLCILWVFLFMAEGKKSFVLYSDHKSIFDNLTDEEAGQLIKHVLKYVNDEDPKTENRIIQIAFEPIKLQLKRDLIKWESIISKRSDAGKASAEKKKQNQQVLTSVESVKQTSTKSTVSVNVNDNVNVNEINIPFVEFWNFYDKKVGNKKDCEKKWVKLKDEERKKIIETLPFFIKSITEKQFQPFPETYLNNRRWEDEISVIQQPEKKIKCMMRNELGEYYPLLTQSEIDKFRSQGKECNIL